MTLEQAKKEAEKLLRRCKKCRDNDWRVDIEGNSYNASEVTPAAEYIVSLIRKIDGADAAYTGD